MRVTLIGAVRYGLRGELFEKGTDYDLPDAKARELLGKRDDYGRPYFIPVVPGVTDAVESSEELPVRRKRGRPPKNRVATSGDTSELPDVEEVKASGPIEGLDDLEDEGVPV